MVPEVFFRPFPRIKVNFWIIVYDPARICNAQAKMSDVITTSIWITFNDIRSFDWTSNVIQIRWNISYHTAHIWWFIWYSFKFFITTFSPKEFFRNLYYLVFVYFIFKLFKQFKLDPLKLDPYKYLFLYIFSFTSIFPFNNRKLNLFVEKLHFSDYYIVVYFVNSFEVIYVMTSLKHNFCRITVYNTTIYLCSLFKFAKHYSSTIYITICTIFSSTIIINDIHPIIREYKFWLFGKPSVWKYCKVSRYYILIWSDDERGPEICI